MSKPIGVAVLITLWTFPIAIPACKLAPALISGMPLCWIGQLEGGAAQQLT